jgi:hypothetical protein
MNGVCGMHGREDKCIQGFFLEGGLKASECIEDMDTDVSIILKCFVRKNAGRVWVSPRVGLMVDCY